MMSARKIMFLSLCNGPSFAKDLDQIRAATLGVLCRINYFDPEIAEIEQRYELNRQLNPEKFKLGDMYRPNLLFAWDAPELNLRDVSFTPVCISNEHKEEFRKAIKKVLDNPKLAFFEETPWKEVENDTSKTTVDGKSYELPRMPPAYKRGVSMLCQIPRERKRKD